MSHRFITGYQRLASRRAGTRAFVGGPQCARSWRDGVPTDVHHAAMKAAYQNLAL